DDPNSISGNYIVSILRDHKDRIWVASFNGGIDRKNPDGNGFIHYSCYNSFRKKYDKNLWKLYEDSHHHIWAGSTMGDALFLYNEERDQFQVFDNTLINIHTLYEDQKGDLWAGNYDQLIKIDTLHKKHTYIHVGFPVRAILQDGPDALWVGTEGGGLLIYQISTGQFQQYTDQEGLPSNTILNLLKDQEGRIWCSTYNGLSVLDAKTRRFTNYNINDGLQSNQFSYNAALELRDGSFLFGGINGFNRFYPDQIHKTIQPLTLRVTDFLIDNQPIENTGYLKGGVTPVDFTTITIPYKDGSFAVHFAGLNYDAPKSVQYGYFLEGWDKDWTHAGNNPMATYSHLYEGSYRLHLAVMGPGGKPLPSTERVIALEILPPWFRSWWAYALYLLSIGALIYGYQKYRQHQTRLLYEIKLTRLNANTERELNERKIAFFTNISHEFRTMLTLIINPIKELMAHGDEIGQPETIKTAYKNSRRMLSLIGQLLLFRKADSEATQLHITKVDLDCLCREVFESFAFQAKTNNIDYRMEVHSDGADDIKADADTKQQPNGEDQEDQEELARELQINGAGCGSTIIYGDAEKIEILLFNLLSNAFKYTPVGGKIYLKLAADDQNVEVWLSDSGKGIPMEEKDKIFMKFYQQNALDGRAKNGFGIGLFLVKDFITRHHATVDFTSAPGQGTVFHLRFQKGKAHFKGEVISESEEYDNGLAQEILESSSAASGGTDNGNVPGTGNDNVAAGSGPNSGRGVYDPNKVGTGAGISALVTEKKTLLIADDNAEIRNFVCRLFQENYHVVAAENGLKAIELMELRLPDLVILDLVMPGKYGDEICQLIKSTESWRHIPVIILTAEASTEIKLRCVESGA
ncbi:MAG TPA: ATP-binding protein, partial [Arachidicoccus sp.]|nr:ATP-binding protein [Arachidicoccus sp.]